MSRKKTSETTGILQHNCSLWKNIYWDSNQPSHGRKRVWKKNAKTMESNATLRKKQRRPKQCKIVRQLEKPSGWEARGLLLKPNRLMHRHKPITRPSVTVHQRKRLFNIIQKCNKVLHRSIGKQWHNQYQIRLSKLTKRNLYHCSSSATILKQT